MRIGYITAACVLVVACNGGPRPYDGVLGYTATKSSADELRITYIEEDKRSVERELEQVRMLCSSQLGLSVSGVSITKLSSVKSEKKVESSVQIPGAFVASGDTKGNYSPGGSGGDSPIISTSNSAEKISHSLTVRTSEYVCTKSGAGSP